MIEDQIKIYNNYQYFNGYCSCCYNKSHLVNDCPKINYVPNKNFIIQRLNYSQCQSRSCNIKIKIKKKFNALFDLPLIKFSANKYSDNFESYNDLNSESNFSYKSETELSQQSPENNIKKLDLIGKNIHEKNVE